MRTELPRRQPGQSRIPSPKFPPTQPRTPDLSALTRLAEALRRWQSDTDLRRQR